MENCKAIKKKNSRLIYSFDLFFYAFRYAFTEYTAPARWFIAMNFTVHSAMYSYYALKAMCVRVPRFISMAITVAQLAQMVAGCAVNLWAYQVRETTFETSKSKV